MLIKLNGKPMDIAAAGPTVGSLLRSKELSPGKVIVELNGKWLKPELWETTPISEGDAVEILSFVGGG